MSHVHHMVVTIVIKQCSFVLRFPKGIVEIIVATMKCHNIQNGSMQNHEIADISFYLFIHLTF